MANGEEAPKIKRKRKATQDKSAPKYRMNQVCWIRSTLVILRIGKQWLINRPNPF